MDQFDTDSDYFMRRADEEQAAAERASDPRARQSHIDLAARYTDAAQACGASPASDEPDEAAGTPSLRPEFRILS